MRISDWSSDVCSSDLSKAEMTARHENQMIDQIDAQGPQEERGILSRAYVGLARRGNARGVVVRHDHRPDPAAEQGPPALWRDDAAPRRIALDALQAEGALERAESGENQRFGTNEQHTAPQIERETMGGG